MKKNKSENLPLSIRWAHFQLFFELSDEEAGKVLKAIIEYRKHGIIPEFYNKSLRIVFNSVRKSVDYDIDRYEEICEKRAESGRKGGLARAHNLTNSLLGANVDDEQTFDREELRENIQKIKKSAKKISALIS